MITPGPLVEVQETGSAAGEVEPGTTWREAVSACLRPADHRVGDDDIFAILNGGSDDATVAELCATKGVTLPMYCVWKTKYRQLDLEQLRKARRREQRRRQSLIGAVALVATLFIVGIGVGLVWTVTSAFKGLTAVPSAAAVVPERRHGAASPPVETRPVIHQTPKSATTKSRLSSDAVPPITETGYRIQVTAADSEQEGRAVVAQLASKGYPTYITRATVGNKDVFRVRVGPFETLLMAEEVAIQLRSAGYQGVWIAR